MAWRIGVDSGGTFTDICLFEENSGRIAVWKVSSTAADPSLAVAEGLAEALAQFGVNASDVCYFGHGTTVATNALIQNRGAPTGLITSDGFRDLLEIGRQKRPELYDLQADKPPVLVDRRLRLEVPERLRYDGRVETALDEVAVHATVRMLRDAGVEAIAICFLYSFLDPAQNYELSVPLPAEAVAPETIDGLADGFATAHQRLYGFVAEDEPMQLVTFRAEATGIVPKADIRPTDEGGPDPRAAEFGRRDVWLREVSAFVSCPLYDRERLLAGNRIEGPAIVEQMDATTLIVPGATATVDPYLNLLLELP